MELYISDHPLDCLTCSANGNCELQTAAGEVGLRDVRYGYEGENHLSAPVDGSNPYFNFDPSKCIVCSRCVRAAFRGVRRPGEASSGEGTTTATL